MVYKDNIIDLHIHTTASDGSFSPAEIIEMAKENNLKAISITDHDTIDGSREALKLGIPSSIDFITGVEISTDVPSFCKASSSIHMLGYYIHLDDENLNKILDELQKARKARTPQIIQKLNNFGVDITEADIRNVVGDRLPGRPHIAEVLLQKKAVKTFQEAFDKYLGKDKAAYVEKYRLDSETAIKAILNAGGMPVLAHPFLLRIKNNQELENLIVYLKELGLMGLEVIYPEHTPEQMKLYSKLAEKHKLFISGGTDFHGSYKPGIKLGVGNGEFQVPYSVYERMKETYHRCFKQISDTDRIKNNSGFSGQYREENNPRLSLLEKKLRYNFKDISLLQKSLQHRSYVNEQPDSQLEDNERMEFLGDAVLNLTVGDLLMKQFPEVNEGDLSRMRATIVNEKQLAEVARKLDLQPHLLLGKGEIHTNGREKQSILADTVEAIIAAVYLDGSFEKAYEFIENHFSKLLTRIRNNDYKSKLQEFVQGIYKETPTYKVIQEVGPDHKKFFKVELVIKNVINTHGSGKSKKIAEQDAAKEAYELLQINHAMNN
ncbi:Ribonuclease III, bacterial [Candidatus Magnetomorum sp. HK-1]|nr:Ribonuclease III, bacterial [Candidatus Magnetomorum sp. HK-1]